MSTRAPLGFSAQAPEGRAPGRQAAGRQAAGRRGLGWRVLAVLAFLALAAGAAAGPAAAQAPADTAATPPPLALRGVLLDEALERVARRAGVDLAYPSELVEGRRAYCRTSATDAEALLRCVLAGTGIDYVRSSGGTYVLFRDRRRSPERGRIVGTVVDAATGEPLPGANVLLADASAGTTTDAGGRFSFGRVLTGVHRVVVTYIGYETQVDSVVVAAGDRRRVRVALRPEPISTGPIVVDGLQQRLPSGSLGRATVEADPMKRITARGTPGVLRRAAGEPGVSMGRPVTDLHVQGGSAGEHALHLDGVPVRDPVSLGGFMGAFSPLAIDRLTVHKAGFEAEHGSYTSGVLSATHDVGRPDDRVAATVDPVSANARGDAQWSNGAGRTGGAMIAARSSTWPVHRASSLDHLLDTWSSPDPTLTPLWIPDVSGPVDVGPQQRSTHTYFSDLHAALRQPLGAFHELYVSLYRADNRMEADLASVLAAGDERRLLQARDHYDWDNTMAQARYDWVASSRLTGTAQLYGSWHESAYSYAIRNAPLEAGESLDAGAGAGDWPAFGDEPAETNRVSEAGGRLSAEYSPAPKAHLDASVEGRFVNGEFRVRNRFVGAVSHATSGWQWSGHVGATVPLGLQTSVEGGLRITHVPLRNRVYAEPRLSVRHDRPNGPLGGVSARLAGGLYRQYVTQSKISSAEPTSVVPSLRFWLPLDASVAPPRAYHVAGGLLVGTGSSWSARLEAYGKRHPRIHQVDYVGLVAASEKSAPEEGASEGASEEGASEGASGRTAGARSLPRQSSFLAAGRGRSYGASLNLERHGPRTTGAVTLAWGTAERRYPGRFDDRWVAAPWEEPLRLTGRVSADVADGLRARARWESIWGRSWALRRIYYDYVAPAGALSEDAPFESRGLPGAPSLDTPGEDRLDPFHRLDLGLLASRTWRGVAVELEASVVNVLGRANPFDASLRPSGSSLVRQHRALPGRRIVAVLSLRY